MGRLYGRENFQPAVILGRICLLQVLFCSILVLVYYLLSLLFSPNYNLFDPFHAESYTFDNNAGGILCISAILTSVLISLLYPTVVVRAKKSLDHTFTLYFFQFIIVALIDTTPSNGIWWLIHIGGFIITAFAGEHFCLRREMADIEVGDILRRRRPNRQAAASSENRELAPSAKDVIPNNVTVVSAVDRSNAFMRFLRSLRLFSRRSDLAYSEVSTRDTDLELGGHPTSKSADGDYLKNSNINIKLPPARAQSSAHGGNSKSSMPQPHSITVTTMPSDISYNNEARRRGQATGVYNYVSSSNSNSPYIGSTEPTSVSMADATPNTETSVDIIVAPSMGSAGNVRTISIGSTSGVPGVELATGGPPTVVDGKSSVGIFSGWRRKNTVSLAAAASTAERQDTSLLPPVPQELSVNISLNSNSNSHDLTVRSPVFPATSTTPAIAETLSDTQELLPLSSSLNIKSNPPEDSQRLDSSAFVSPDLQSAYTVRSATTHPSTLPNAQQQRRPHAGSALSVSTLSSTGPLSSSSFLDLANSALSSTLGLSQPAVGAGGPGFGSSRKDRSGAGSGTHFVD